MILLLFPSIGAVSANSISESLPNPTFITSGVTVTPAALRYTVTIPVATGSLGPSQYPVSLPLLLNTTPPGLGTANIYNITCSPIRTVAGGALFTPAAIPITMTAPPLTTQGSPGSNQPVIQFNGVTRTPIVRWDTVTAAVPLGQEPRECSFTVNNSAFTPTYGMDIRIGLQSVATPNLIFGGTITDLEQSYDGILNNTVWHVRCTGYTYLFRRRYPVGVYQGQTVTSVVQQLVAANSSGFTVGNVATISTLVTVSFDGTQDLAACITRLANMVGAYWYIDHARDVHFFVNPESIVAPVTIDNSNTTTRLSPAFKYSVDITQVRNRVTVKGGSGGSTSVPINGAIQSAVPLTSALLFNLTGGQAIMDVPLLGVPGGITYPVIFNYSQAAQGSLATATPQYVGPPSSVAFSASSAGGSPGPYQYSFVEYVFTYVTRGGETAYGGSISTFIPWSGGTQLNMFSPPVPVFAQSQGVYQVNVYRGYVGTLVHRQVGSFNIASNGYWPSSFVDNVPDSQLGNVAPQVGTATYGPVTVVTSGPNFGNTLPIAGTPGVLPLNGVVTVAGVPFWFTASGNAITLNGLYFTVPTGTVLVTQPGLFISSGQFGLIPAGASVNVYVQVDDTTSQSTMASHEGGDGIHVHSITDTSLTYAQALARAQAELAYFKNPKVTIQYETTDINSVPGAQVPLNLSAPASLSGNYMIQRVDYTKVGTHTNPDGTTVPPTIKVTASNTKYSLQDLLRQLGGLLDINGIVY